MVYGVDSGAVNPLSVSYFFKESVEIVLYHVKIGYFKLDISRPS